MIRSAAQRFVSDRTWVIRLLVGTLLVLAIGGLVTLAIKQGVVRWTLKIATGPVLTSRADFLNTVTKIINEERPMVQLKRLKKDSFSASAKAMEDGEADLAIVRSDIAMPSNGLTIAILRRDHLVLIVPGNSGLTGFQGLAGKKIGLLKTEFPERNESLSRILDGVLDYYNISHDQLQREFLTLDEVGPAMAKHQFAGILALGPSGPGPISKAIAAIGNASNTSPKLIGEKQAQAIAKTIPGTEPNEIDEGAFGGAKPKPEEALNTLAVTLRLVGRHSLPDFVTSEVARVLTLTKARLIATSPLARDIEAPDSDDGSGLPVHPGAVAYFDGEQGSLLDSAFSVFYLSSILLGLLGSCIVWLFSFGEKGGANDGQIDSNRLIVIMREARNANQETLDQMETEIHDLLARLINQGKVHAASLPGIIAIAMRQVELQREKLHSANQETSGPKS